MLTTERLILRRWRPADAAPFSRMNADPEIADPFEGPLTPDRSNDFIACCEDRWHRDGFSFAAVERRSDGVFMGMPGLSRCDLDLPFCPCVEIGWRFARAYWGNGYATEAARAWLAYGLNDLGLDRIVAFTDRNHHPSLAVMRRAGMRPDPSLDFDHPDLPEGHPMRPHVVYVMSLCVTEPLRPDKRSP